MNQKKKISIKKIILVFLGLLFSISCVSTKAEEESLNESVLAFAPQSQEEENFKNALDNLKNEYIKEGEDLSKGVFEIAQADIVSQNKNLKLLSQEENQIDIKDCEIVIEEGKNEAEAVLQELRDKFDKNKIREKLESCIDEKINSEDYEKVKLLVGTEDMETVKFLDDHEEVEKGNILPFRPGNYYHRVSFRRKHGVNLIGSFLKAVSLIKEGEGEFYRRESKGLKETFGNFSPGNKEEGEFQGQLGGMAGSAEEIANILESDDYLSVFEFEIDIPKDKVDLIIQNKKITIHRCINGDRTKIWEKEKDNPSNIIPNRELFKDYEKQKVKTKLESCIDEQINSQDHEKVKLLVGTESMETVSFLDENEDIEKGGILIFKPDNFYHKNAFRNPRSVLKIKNLSDAIEKEREHERVFYRREASGLKETFGNFSPGNKEESEFQGQLGGMAGSAAEIANILESDNYLSIFEFEIDVPKDKVNMILDRKDIIIHRCIKDQENAPEKIWEKEKDNPSNIIPNRELFKPDEKSGLKKNKPNYNLESLPDNTQLQSDYNANTPPFYSWSPSLGINKVDLRNSVQKNISSYFWWNDVSGFSSPFIAYEHELRVPSWSFLECKEVWKVKPEFAAVDDVAIDTKMTLRASQLPTADGITSN